MKPYFSEVFMNCKKLFGSAAVAALSLVAVVGSIAIAADAAKEKKDAPAAQQAPQLPPGWTEADMKAFAAAATPGKNHEHLAKDLGAWTGKSTMWMSPDGEPAVSECKATVRWLIEGRYTQVEHDGEMPGMGPYKGIGTYGFDNVSKKFVSTWLDNHGTGIMRGEGDLAPDGKTLTWKFTFNCPLKKGPEVMREVETWTGPDSKKLEMYGADPKSGKEYKMMLIELTRKGGVPATAR
jgi:hypothetical protein